MRSMLIIPVKNRHDAFGLKSFTVIRRETVSRSMCYDEMLGTVVQFLQHKPVYPVGVSDRVFAGKGVEIVKNVERVIAIVERATWFSVAHRGRMIERMTWNEALGFIAAYTLTGKELFGGMTMTPQI